MRDKDEQYENTIQNETERAQLGKQNAESKHCTRSGAVRVNPNLDFVVFAAAEQPAWVSGVQSNAADVTAVCLLPDGDGRPLRHVGIFSERVLCSPPVPLLEAAGHVAGVQQV